jgi:2-C-methyl-D-erythritol 4-phosphate cytidylyltransferase
MDRLRKYAVIVAGGSGSRMGSSKPKQFMELNGLPILMHTIRHFREYDGQMDIVVVLPHAHLAAWDALREKHAFSLPHEVVEGGETRFQSVKRGLGMLQYDGLVAIHDGVRPLASGTLIERCFSEAAQYGNAIPAVAVTDTVRAISGLGENYPLERQRLRLVQTPQVFDLKALKTAYLQPFREAFTDDASVFEAAGHAIHLVEGARENIKITLPLDFIVAETLMRSKLSDMQKNQAESAVIQK